MEKIYSSVPVDKKASMVTSQSGCTEELTTEQQRQNLISRYQRLQEEIIKFPKNSPRRKELGQELQELNQRIRVMKSRKKKGNLKDYIINILKENMTKYEWKLTVDIAVKRQNEDEIQSIMKGL